MIRTFKCQVDVENTNSGQVTRKSKIVASSHDRPTRMDPPGWSKLSYLRKADRDLAPEPPSRRAQGPVISGPGQRCDLPHAPPRASANLALRLFRLGRPPIYIHSFHRYGSLPLAPFPPPRSHCGLLAFERLNPGKTGSFAWVGCLPAPKFAPSLCGLRGVGARLTLI